MRVGAALAVWLIVHSGVAVAAQAPQAVASQDEDVDVINPDRPGIADGSAVIGRGRVQIESGVQYERRDTDGGTEGTVLIPALLRIGVSRRWEARIESNIFTQVQTDACAGANAESLTACPAVRGVSPISLGAKVQLQDSAGVRRPSLGIIGRLFPPSGTGSFHADRATGDVRVAADWDLTSRLSLNPNVGVAVYEDDEGKRFMAGLFAVTLGYFNRAKTLNPFVDLGVQAPETPGGRASVIVDGGVAYLPTRNLQLDVSAGTGPGGRTPPRWFVSGGISLRFREGT